MVTKGPVESSVSAIPQDHSTAAGLDMLGHMLIYVSESAVAPLLLLPPYVSYCYCLVSSDHLSGIN